MHISTTPVDLYTKYNKNCSHHVMSHIIKGRNCKSRSITMMIWVNGITVCHVTFSVIISAIWYADSPWNKCVTLLLWECSIHLLPFTRHFSLHRCLLCIRNAVCGCWRYYCLSIYNGDIWSSTFRISLSLSLFICWTENLLFKINKIIYCIISFRFSVLHKPTSTFSCILWKLIAIHYDGA